MVWELGAASLGAAWVWDKFGKDLLENLGLVSQKAWTRFNWSGAANDYRNKVRNLYGHIRVFGSPYPTPLENIFTDVYILDQPTALRRFDLTEIREAPEMLDVGTRVEGVQLVQKEEHKHLFILGSPGAGKTTFLKYLALQAVEQKIDRVPIFVGLKDWSDSGLELMPFLAKQFQICNFPDARSFIEHILRQGKALVLFDGLDEVPKEDDRRTQLIRVLTDFSNHYDQSQCMITCRIAANEYTFKNFTYVEIAPFTETQIEHYVGKWFAHSEQKRKRFLQELQKEEHRGLREMLRTPLLLSMLCLAFDQTIHIPRRRVEIYEESIEVLLKKWDASRNIRRDEGYAKLTLGRKRQLFAHIAAETFHRGSYFWSQQEVEQYIADYLYDLPPTELTDEIDAEAVLKAIESQHGIVVERAYRIYAFAHLSFHEYFTAKHLADNASEKLFDGMFREHLTNKAWREVFLILASLLDNANTFFASFQKAIDALVAEDEMLIALLQWAQRKAMAVTDENHAPAAVRSTYCSFNFVCIRTFTNPTDFDWEFSLSRALTSALDFALELDLVRASVLTLNIALDLALDLIQTLELTHSRKHTHPHTRDINLEIAFALSKSLSRTHNLALALTTDLDPYLALDVMLFSTYIITHVFEQAGEVEKVQRQIPEFATYFQKIITFAHNNGATNVATALETLQVPTTSNAQDAWVSFGQALQTLMQQHRDMGHAWNLSEEQVQRFADYVDANRLLLECLQLGYVSDREGIKRGLLLPPGAQPQP